MVVPLEHVIGLSAILFTIGTVGALTRRNLVVILMSIELMLNAANLSFVSWSRVQSGAGAMQGQVAPLFSIAIAAAEACVGLAMLLAVFRSRESLDTDAYSRMKE